MKWRWSLSAVALVLAGVATLWLLPQPKIEPPPVKSGVPDYELEEAQIDHMDEHGNLTYRLKSPYVAEYLEPDVARFRTPTLWVYREPGRSPTRIDAEQGELHHRDSLVDLHGRVLLDRPADALQGALNVDTSEVTIKMNDKTATTGKPAAARGDHFSANGVGASMDLRTGDYRIDSQAVGVYEAR